MITVLSALVSLLSFRLRGRASLELELIALRHQGQSCGVSAQAVRAFEGRPSSLGVVLYRIWPQALHVMALVEPATVIQWSDRRRLALYERANPS
jgi:hypothetical protein